jgi:methanogenic corrinoid protein MtbC1
MTNSNSLVAAMLETSAAGYASAANAVLANTQHGLSHSAAGASAEWKAHLTQRVLELAAAVRVNEPKLFATRISWLRRAFKARGADESELRSALESLRTALNQELPDTLKSAVEQPIQLALDSLDTELEPEAHSLDATTPQGKLGFRYLAACLEARTKDAVTLILESLDSGVTPQEVYTGVLLPAQREVGQLWHIGEISVAEERLVSETTREVMTLIVNRFALVADPARTVLLASVTGNAHDIGLRAAADLFRLAGWHTIFLGADMPTSEIAQAAQRYNATLVALSATLTTQLGTLAAAVEHVRKHAGKSRILVGGLALEGSPELWKQMGADGYAPEIDSIVAIAASLVRDS